MKTDSKVPKDIDEYIAQQPEGVRGKLEQMRAVVREAAPDAEETISYMMPTFRLAGNLVHFAAFKNHIGFYPVPSGIEAFKKELAGYKGAKGSVQFPLDEPLPLDLVRRIVEFRVVDNLEKAALKSKKAPKQMTPNGNVFKSLSAPAQRALAGKGIVTLEQLAKFSEREILALHGVGPSAIPKLRAVLKSAGLGFKK